MSEPVDVSWIRERLAASAGISESRAGELIHSALAEGTLAAVASHATRRPEGSASDHADDDFIEDDFAIPREFWNNVQVGWGDRYLYFRFFHKRQVWLVSALSVDRRAAIAFLRTNDPMHPPPAAPEKPPAGTKGAGGAPSKVDWEKCLIEAARWMYVNGRPRTQADLIRHIEDWLGDAAPGSTQLKLHLGPLYQAFERADRSD